jgi:hypothetical protein
MKTTKFLKNFFISITIIIIFSVHTVFAETRKTGTTTASTTKTTDITLSTESSDDKKINPEEIKDSAKKISSSIFQKIDSWRANQSNIWSALKLEKQEEVKIRDAKMDQGLIDRTNRVLEGEQASVVQGSVKDFDANIFLLKIYIAIISLFVLIFSYPVVFYAVVILLILVVVHRIYERIRYGV